MRWSAMALVVLSACQEPLLEDVEYPSEMGCSHCGPSHLLIDRGVDILFVIDNSISMGPEQAALARGFAAMAEVLERPDVSANYRIGVTTTDNGHPWCSGTEPEAGQLQASSCRGRLDEFAIDELIDETEAACLDVCPQAWSQIDLRPTAVDYEGELRDRPWIESINGETNLPKGLSLTQAFACMAPQGVTGCGFEQPLESMWKTIRRSGTQGDDAWGFIRDEAALSVVHVTDEADCSYNNDWDTVFLPDGDRVFWSDPDAVMPTSAACWNAGVQCTGSGTYDDCTPVDLDVEGNPVAAEDADDLAVLRPMSRYIDQLDDLEESKQRIMPDREVLVSLIVGAQSDGSVLYQDAGADPMFVQDFGIGPGCTGSAGSAVPPVRLRALAEQFDQGVDQAVFSTCDDDYSSTLRSIGEAIAAQFRPACYWTCVADSDPMTEVLEPSCVVIQERPQPDGEWGTVELPQCGPGDAVPEGSDACYVQRVGDARHELCADIGLNLELDIARRPGFVEPAGTAYLAQCDRSDEPEIDCPELF